MTSAKISGMVSTPGTLDTGLSKVTGTVEKGLCATGTGKLCFCDGTENIRLWKPAAYQWKSGRKRTYSNNHTAGSCSRQHKETECKGEFSYTESGRAADQLEDTKDAFETGVKEILKDELGVSDEQVEDAMSILGLQWMDLLNPASLSQLVTQLTGTEDACSLLMSEEFTNIMQNTDALVQNLSETLGISKDEWVALQNQLAELTAVLTKQWIWQMAAYRKWLHRLMRQLLHRIQQ